MTIHEHLKYINACEEAINWASSRKTGQQCWDETERIDWIFWWARQSRQIEQLTLCTRLIAESVAYLKNSPAPHAAAYAYAAAYAAAEAFPCAYAYTKAAHSAKAAEAAAEEAAYIDDSTVYSYLGHVGRDARNKQRALNLKIAKETLVCPFPN